MANPRAGNQRCPCTSGLPWDECCGPVLAGARPAPTAVALMRSRFTAFATGDRDYLLRSWHPRTRPERLDLDDTLHWYRLDIESHEGGSPFESGGEVTFTAFYRLGDGESATLRERSQFERLKGRWVYVDGVVT